MSRLRRFENSVIKNLKSKNFPLPTSNFQNLKQIVRSNTLIVLGIIYRTFGEEIIH